MPFKLDAFLSLSASYAGVGGISHRQYSSLLSLFKFILFATIFFTVIFKNIKKEYGW